MPVSSILVSANLEKSAIRFLGTTISHSDVAGKLGMHRNNVIYHVKQISEEFHLNFDDPDVRLRLLMSFEVLKFSKLFIR